MTTTICILRKRPKVFLISRDDIGKKKRREKVKMIMCAHYLLNG